MSFVSLEFLGYLIVTTIVFYLMPERIRKYWLLIASYYFYVHTDWRLLVVLIGVTALTHIGGRVIDKSRRHKKLFYRLFFLLNISILLVFKYTAFMAESLDRILKELHIVKQLPVPEFFVPIGLSFIIFQSTTYLGDIYKEKIKPASIVNHALFVAFFPTVLSGPIQRAGDLINQFVFQKKFDIVQFQHGMLLVVYGLFEKLFVADKLALFVNQVYNQYDSYGGAYYFMAAVCYSIQIYADFSSYSDIARGVSKLFGIEVTKNFTNPYLSRNLVEFWKNWHVSLNNWLVEYVYIPLGGSRRGTIRKYVNVMIVFIISGLWHGASWHFVFWGAVNGLLQVIGQVTNVYRQKIKKSMGLHGKSLFERLYDRIIVFLFITGTWILFRAPSLYVAIHFGKSILTMGLGGLFNTNIWGMFGEVDVLIGMIMSLAVFALVQIVRREDGRAYNIYQESPVVIQVVGMSVVIAVVFVGLCATVAQPDTSFIYFQF